MTRRSLLKAIVLCMAMMACCVTFSTCSSDENEPEITPTNELTTIELDNFVVYVCVGGRATLVPDGGVACTLAQGKTVLVPACVRMVEIRPEGGVKLLECGV